MEKKSILNLKPSVLSGNVQGVNFAPREDTKPVYMSGCSTDTDSGNMASGVETVVCKVNDIGEGEYVTSVTLKKPNPLAYHCMGGKKTARKVAIPVTFSYCQFFLIIYLKISEIVMVDKEPHKWKKNSMVL